MSEPVTVAEIDLAAIAHNLRAIREKVVPARVMAVVKCNAYGHGLRPVVQLAWARGVRHFGVARLEEGEAVRAIQPEAAVLVFGGFLPEQVAGYLQADLEFTLFDLERARLLSAKAREFGATARVHVKVDTGMGRVGVPWREAADFVVRVRDLEALEVRGLYTHFAESDHSDKAYTHTQLERFNRVLAELSRRRVEIPLTHAANSGAILDLPESYFDLVRAGVSLYGYYPSRQTSESLSLRPAMRLKSRVLAVRKAAEGTYVSYGRTHRTSRATRLATVAVGYGDGYNRLLSNRGEVLIRGRRRPVVGRVCMDQIVVDVGPDDRVAVGDEVVLLGRQGNEQISIYEICEKLNTIPYEVTTWVAERVPRVYLDA